MYSKVLASICVAAVSLMGILAPDPAQAQVSAKFKNMRKDIRVAVENINGQRTYETMTIKRAMKFYKVEGAVVVTIVGDQIETLKHFGYRNIDDGLPVDANTIFPTASLSKLPAALAVVIGARKGKGPKLGRAIGKIADAHPGSVLNHWYKTRSKVFWSDATGAPHGPSMRRLLSHTAGLSRHGVSTSLATCDTHLRNVLLGLPKPCENEATNPFAIPGTVFDYSGGGFTVAEAAVEEVSGQSAEAFLQEHFMDEFAMTLSTYERANPTMTNLARPCYDRGKIACSEYVLFTDVKFAGGLLAHPVDYAKLVSILMNDGKTIGGKQVLQPDELEDILTPIWHRDSSLKSCTSSCSSGICLSGKCRVPLTWDGQRYGLGVKVDNEIWNGLPRVFHHGGGQPGVSTIFWADRKEKKAIVVFSIGEKEFNTPGHLPGVSTDLPGGYDFVWDLVYAFQRAY